MTDEIMAMLQSINRKLDLLLQRQEIVKKEPKKESKKGTHSVSGMITSSTEKALMLMIDGKEEWYPKSTIHNDYQEMVGLDQDFVIDNWILKNKKVIE